jgi:hypothetical protein
MSLIDALAIVLILTGAISGAFLVSAALTYIILYLLGQDPYE